MEIKINPRNQFPGKGLCIHLFGDWVTEAVWRKVSALMSDNYITSPVYQARTKSGAFFQGGSENSRGKRILIEFWKPEEDCQDFIKILNDEINKVIDPNRSTIRVVANTANKKDVDNRENVCKMISEETGCALANERELAGQGCSAMFIPTSNVQFEAVQLLLDYTFPREVKRLSMLDKWEMETL